MIYIYICTFIWIYIDRFTTMYINIFLFCCTCIYMCKYICIHIYTYHFFVIYDVFQQCQLDTGCRSRRALPNAIVKRDLRQAGVARWSFPIRKGVIYGELAMWGWRNQGKRGLGEPRGTAIWSLRINKHSKNRSKQRLVRANHNTKTTLGNRWTSMKKD